MITGERLAEMWPEASRRLRHALEAQGIEPANAEDLVSEAVTRALATGLRADSVDDFCRWAYRVARNLHVDWLRAGSRLAPESEFADRASGDDVTHLVEQRLLCETTLRSIAELSAGDRDAIIESIGATPPNDRREAVRLAVRRHRARARLLKLVGGVLTKLGALRVLLRGDSSRTSTTVAFAWTVVPGAALLLTPFAKPMPGVSPESRPPVVVISVAETRAAVPAPVVARPATEVARPAKQVPHRPTSHGHIGNPPPAANRITPPPGFGGEGDGITYGNDKSREGALICPYIPTMEADCVRQVERPDLAP